MVPAHILELPTPRLLAYYKKHYRHTCNPYWDRDYEEYTDKEKHAEWEANYAALKTELDKREHVKKL